MRLFCFCLYILNCWKLHRLRPILKQWKQKLLKNLKLKFKAICFKQGSPFTKKDIAPFYSLNEGQFETHPLVYLPHCTLEDLRRVFEAYFCSFAVDWMLIQCNTRHTLENMRLRHSLWLEIFAYKCCSYKMHRTKLICIFL